MEDQKKILIVEDEIFRETLVAILARSNYKADGAANLREALQAIDQCFYHVALVDIMLGGARDISNRDGLKVLQYLKDYNEGTKSIVLSGQPERQLIADIILKYGAFDFIYKGEAFSVPALLEKIDKAIKLVNINSFIEWPALIKLMAWPQKEMKIVSDCMQLIDFKGGFENLSRSIIQAAKSLVPILIPTDVERALEWDKDILFFRGKYWSKGQGFPIEFFIGSKSQDSKLNKIIKEGNIIYEKEKGNLEIIIKRIDGDRSRFYIPKEK